jgi:phage baseplate assembly protein W
MASRLEKFRDVTVGSAGRILDYDSKISSFGDFSKIYDIDAILTSWNNILITQIGTMDHDPEFGSRLYNYVFEPEDEFSQEGIKNEIIRCLTRYDDRAQIEDLQVNFYSNRKGFTVSILVSYGGYKANLKLTMDENTLNNFR